MRQVRVWFRVLVVGFAILTPCGAQEISEFMASNRETLLDGNGNDSDWIEIHNAGDATIELSGWFLTDSSGNLEKWSFPAGVALDPGAYLVVFATSRDDAEYVDPDGFLHTSFSLSAGGEYLALVRPDGVTVASEYSPAYPAQSADVSYGRLEGEAQFFTTPTPGAANEANPIASPGFSQLGGLITAPFDLELSVENADAEIRFTLNGRLPREDSDLYTTPLVIDTTTHVRARAFSAAGVSQVVSHSYLLLADDVLDFSSNLPLVVVDSLGININATAGNQENRSRAPRRPVYSVFLDTGEDGRARLTDAPDFSGRAGMKIRGNSSQVAPKKQYSLEVWDEDDSDRSVPILGLPAESDWVFHAPYGDKTLMRNYLAYKWWGDLGHYSVRTRHFELFYNFDDGVVTMDDYAGVYLLVEKIKRDRNRVDVEKLTPIDNSEPEVSGGYIVKVDVLDPGETVFRTPRGSDNGYIITEPADRTSEQRAWIKDYFEGFERALYADNFTDPERGYASWIDVESFVDYFLMTEMVKNADGFHLSIFYHKARGEKLAMGPIWDFNVCLGNDLDWATWIPTGWLSVASQALTFYYRRLFEDPALVDYRRERWWQWRDVLTSEQLFGDIDETAELLEEAQQRNFERWDILGKRVLPGQVNPPGFEDRDTYEKEVAWMRNWLVERLVWLDSRFLFPPRFSVEGPMVEELTEVTLTNPNPAGGEIVYTLDGDDPRDSADALVFGEPIVITENVLVRARVLQGEDSWSDLAEALYLVDIPSLAITEIMYDPTDGLSLQFIEVKNFGDEAESLEGVRFTRGLSFTFDEGTLQPGEHIVVVKRATLFAGRYGEDIRIAGEFRGVLSNDGGTIALEGPFEETIASFTYSNEWYPETNGLGHSLVLVDPTSSPESWSERSSWRPSVRVGGSPGEDDPMVEPAGSQIAGDTSQDGRLNVIDPVLLLRFLSIGTVDRLPCGDGTLAHRSNVVLFDTDGDGTVNLTDAIYNLNYLFRRGPVPVQGAGCVEIPECPEACVQSD